MHLSQPDALQALGSEHTAYQYDGADPALLERFPNPMTRGPGKGTVHITAPEFTSLCPKTGQPDFANIVVDYHPRDWCVESKSWKLYLGSYRNVGEFHESCVRRITNDLIRLLDPESLVVRGEFTPRGGIPFWPTVTYSRPRRVVCRHTCDAPPVAQPDYRGGVPGAARTEFLLLDHLGIPLGTAIGYEGGAAADFQPTFVELFLFSDDLGDASQIAPQG